MNNTIVLEGCLKQFKEQNEFNGSDSEIFELFCLTQNNKNTEFSIEDLEASIVDGGNDGGIDSIILYLDEEYLQDEEAINSFRFSKSTRLKISISQIKYEKSFKETTLDKIITSLPIVLDLETNENCLSQRFNPQLVERISLLRKSWMETVKKGGNIEVEVIYFCKANQVEANSTYNLKSEQLINIVSSKINGAKVKFINISSKELLEMYQKARPSRLSLTFKEVPVTTSFKEGYGYVGIVGLSDYYKFITDDSGSIIEDIFESNIRHYQGDVDVNNKIADSLRNEFTIDFWWLNNGITIIAESPNQISKTLTLENVQIVNGLQTTFTIEKYFKSISHDHDKNDRSILAKVIIINGEDNKESIDRIIASTNSQNAVPPVLLRATDDIQRKIEIFFSNNGYFYDRRKNYYKNMAKPVSKIFGIQTTAQAIQAILNKEPDTARAKPTTLIKTRESYDIIFNDSIDFKVYLNCALLYRKVSDHIKNEFAGDRKSLARAYALHFSRIVAASFCGKGDYSQEEIKNINLDSILVNDFNSIYGLLEKYVNEFKENSTTISDSSVSKSGIFREFLNRKLMDIEEANKTMCLTFLKQPNI
jgi:hypothetical protein